jgi:hypothetical protein
MATLSTIYGLFPDPDSAERGMIALRDAGVNRENIVILSDEPFEEYSFGHAEPSVAMPWLAVMGGLIGGTGGYLLARVTQTAYPLVTGGMPIVAPFPTAIVTYELTMLGAVLTTIITLLITAEIPRWKQPLYDPEVSNGKILIAVIDPADDARSGLEDKLRAAGADEIKSTGRFSTI